MKRTYLELSFVKGMNRELAYAVHMDVTEMSHVYSVTIGNDVSKIRIGLETGVTEEEIKKVIKDIDCLTYNIKGYQGTKKVS